MPEIDPITAGMSLSLLRRAVDFRAGVMPDSVASDIAGSGASGMSSSMSAAGVGSGGIVAVVMPGIGLSAAAARRGVTGRLLREAARPAAAVFTPAVRVEPAFRPAPRVDAAPVRDAEAAAGFEVVGLGGGVGFGAGLAAPARVTVALPAAVRPTAALPAVTRPAEACPGTARPAVVRPARARAAVLPASPAFTAEPIPLFREISDRAAAADFAVSTDFAVAEVLVAAALAADGLAVDALAADRAEADFTAGFVAVARFGVLGLGTAGRVVVVVRTVVVLVVREVAAATFVPAVPAGLPGADALVEAFLAAAIWVFLLANDCGLVSAWRLRIPAWTQGVTKPVLACLPGPAGILGIPLGIALLDGFECPRRFVSRGVGTEPVLSGTHVIASLDTAVAKAPKIAASAGPTVVHAITVHLKPTIRHRFGQKVPNFQCGLHV
ncbi:hypothetical protein [Paractinoplanes tereljensis]|uniref:hypothetical protein n=1 Tax=Paractinoplanes tereljensis TaxID=571912 RepID=UPI001944CDF8|nr:hypothetical protein [Actinoplanes tereljensis]